MNDNIFVEKNTDDNSLIPTLEGTETINNIAIEGDNNEKLETKGLKLKKSTKERLNQLQSGFGDAETMISSLLNQYEVFNIEGKNKFADRKAEIDRFNYLMESLKSSFLNSLEMATYMEEKYSEKFSSELKKKDKIIVDLQESQKEFKDLLKTKEKENEDINKELISVKESFSRLNFALTTVEKELKEKSEIIQNNQKHISALTEVSEEGKLFKEKYINLTKNLADLKVELNTYKLTNELLSISKEENSRYKEETLILKDEISSQRNYINDLNEKIQTILIEKAETTDSLRDDFDKRYKELELNKNKEIQEYIYMVNKLREEIFSLKLLKDSNEMGT